MVAIPQNPRGVIDLRIILSGKSPTDVTNLLTDSGPSAGGGDLLRKQVARLVAGGPDGAYGVGLVARARGITTPYATSSFTVTAASITAGDKFILIGPEGPVTLTAVASGENPFLGQYAANGSDANFATSLRLAINCYAPAARIVSAAGSTNTVALTSTLDGIAGNSVTLVKQVTTAGVFSFTSGVAMAGGIGLDTSKSITVTVGTNPAADQTLRFGNVVLTYKASATNENEVTIGGDTTITATNLAAKINAHSILGGIVSATSATNVVTVTAVYPDLLHYLLYIVSSTGNVTVSGQIQQTGETFTAGTAYAATQGVF